MHVLPVRPRLPPRPRLSRVRISKPPFSRESLEQRRVASHSLTSPSPPTHFTLTRTLSRTRTRTISSDIVADKTARQERNKTCCSCPACTYTDGLVPAQTAARQSASVATTRCPFTCTYMHVCTSRLERAKASACGASARASPEELTTNLDARMPAGIFPPAMYFVCAYSYFGHSSIHPFNAMQPAPNAAPIAPRLGFLSLRLHSRDSRPWVRWVAGRLEAHGPRLDTITSFSPETVQYTSCIRV